MSLMKWIIISTVISIPFMFLLPPEDNFSYNQSVNNSLAQTDFSFVCANALMQGCSIELFRPFYAECVQTYGNVTLEQCMTRCCGSP
jgi:hypothetical protein